MLKMISFVFLLLFSISPASAETIVTGKITGFAGRPIPLANVSLSQPNDKLPEKIVEAGRTGGYKIAIDSKGVWLLRFSGVFHQDYTVAVYVDEPKVINLNVALATYKYGNSFGIVKVLGNFNRWYPPSAVPMHKRADGTYAAEIRTKVDPVLYQLTGVLARNIPGTKADRYAYDQNVGYSAVLEAKHGKVRVTFDPGKLLGSDEPASFTFSGSDSVEWRFARVYDELQRWNTQYNDAFIRSIGRRGSDKKHIDFDYDSVLSTVDRQLKSEQNEVVRQELHLINFLFLFKSGAADSSNARNVLKEIPPASAVWSLSPVVISNALDLSKHDDIKRRRYVEEVMSDNPSGDAIAALLSNEFMIELYRGNKEQAMRYYDVAVNQYGDTPGGKEVSHYHHLSAVDPGKTVPEFSVDLMRRSPKAVSNKYFRGRYYLMCFWATWSKSSVEEIVFLKKAYRKFRRRGLSVLSLSLDASRQAVEKFQKRNGNLPWLNAIIGEGFKSKICRDFEVFAVPKPILVDPEGKIVAVGLDLRGDKLTNTLAKYLDKKKVNGRRAR